MNQVLRRITVFAIPACLCVSVGRPASAQAFANSFLQFFDVKITAASGTIQYVGNNPNVVDPRWTAKAFAEASNSLGEHDAHPDPGLGEATEVKGGAIVAKAQVTYANALGAADAVNLTGSALSDVHIPDCDDIFAAATGRGQIFNSFIITGGTGAVDVTFSTHIKGALHVLTGDCGVLAQTETIFGWELFGLDSAGNPIDTPILFDDRILQILGPDQHADEIVDLQLTKTLSLKFTDGTLDTTYATLLEADSESIGITSMPEPSAGIVAVIGMAMLAGVKSKRMADKRVSGGAVK